MPKFHRGWATVLFVVVAVIVAASLIAFPEWQQSLPAILVLLGLVLVAVISALADLRNLLVPPSEPPVPIIAPKSEITSIQHDEQTTIDARQVATHDILNITGDYVAPTAPAVTSLHQLPPPPADFTGREAELADLREKALKRGAIISGFGMGGVGKTALALELADELQTQYPDAHLYIDLQGISQKPVTPAEALSRFIQAFEPEARLPVEIEQLVKIYRSLLHDKKAIVLLDNAQEAQQVEPLIPPPSCLLLITSRATFSLPGLYSKNLDTLPPKDARDLLLKICARIEEAAEDMAQRCGYLPLALRLTASALAEQADVTPAELIQRMNDVQTKLNLTGVQASLQLSYALLTEDAAHIFRQLAVFPADFDSAAEEAVCEDAGHKQLSELVRRSLVSFNPDTSRYRLHDLARDFADRKLSEAEKYEAQKRHAKYYLNVIHEANRLYKVGETLLHGLSLFDDERANIEAGHSWAVVNIKSNDTEVIYLCCYYPYMGAYILPMRLLPREFISWTEIALTSAQNLGDRNAELAHFGNLAYTYKDTGQIEKAIAYSEKQLTIAQALGNQSALGAALSNLGVLYLRSGDFSQAIEFLTQHLNVARNAKDQRGEGNALGNLGNAYASAGKMNEAVTYYEKQLFITKVIDDKTGEGIALGNLGVAYFELGNLNKAMSFFKRAIAIDRKIGNRRAEGDALWNMSRAFEKANEAAKAVFYAKAALKIREEIDDPRAEKIRKWLAEYQAEANSTSNG